MAETLVVCRFLHFCAVLLMFGSCFAQPLLLTVRPSPYVARRALVINRGLAWLAFGSAVAWLLLSTHSMTGSWATALEPGTLQRVLASTFFGQVWGWHLLFSLLLIGALYRANGARTSLLLSFLLLATLAPVGHGAMLDGWRGQLLMLNQLLHLVCVGAWLGGLLLLLLIVVHAGPTSLKPVLRRFSGLGCVWVAVILLTGWINIRVLTGTWWPTPWFEGFAFILLIKVCLVTGMLLLALCNVWMNRTGNHALLRSSVTLEWLLGLAAVAAVSLLGTLAPLSAG